MMYHRIIYLLYLNQKVKSAPELGIGKEENNSKYILVKKKKYLTSKYNKFIYILSSMTNRQYSKLTRIKIDPGINKVKKVIGPLDLENFEENEMDNLESDFMDINKSYKQHVKELEGKNELLKYHIVKEKYFKEKFPNFLCWQDKEQIRFLHNKDPEEWTIDKLSESFPALPEVIKKIIASTFSKSDSKIRNHDAVVEKNWRDLKAGKLENLPPDLSEHLKKFTARKVSTQPIEKRIEVVNKPKLVTEFSDIITSYEKLKNKNTNNESNENYTVNLKQTTKNLEQGTFLTINKMKDKTPKTLSELQGNIQNKAVKGQELTQEEKLIFQDFSKSQNMKEPVELRQSDEAVISDNKYSKGTGSSLAKKTERDYSHLIYPEKIVIPKELKKRGYTYKLNDCYYDCDGEFLYRVPGMS